MIASCQLSDSFEVYIKSNKPHDCLPVNGPDNFDNASPSRDSNFA